MFNFFPTKIFSFFLISDFSGNKYVFILVSNQIAVFHSVSPIFAEACNLPHPASSDSKTALISFDNFIGSEINIQPPFPGYCQGSAVKAYWILGLFMMAKEFTTILWDKLLPQSTYPTFDLQTPYPPYTSPQTTPHHNAKPSFVALRY